MSESTRPCWEAGRQTVKLAKVASEACGNSRVNRTSPERATWRQVAGFLLHPRWGETPSSQPISPPRTHATLRNLHHITRVHSLETRSAPKPNLSSSWQRSASASCGNVAKSHYQALRGWLIRLNLFRPSTMNSQPSTFFHKSRTSPELPALLGNRRRGFCLYCLRSASPRCVNS